jgi:hypothetical protein
LASMSQFLATGATTPFSDRRTIGWSSMLPKMLRSVFSYD